MTDEPAKSPKTVKTVLRIGGGERPGYLWNVLVMNVARQEAAAFLGERQYRRLAAKFRSLAGMEEPSRGGRVDVRPVEDFFEVRDKGGELGRLNVRVFFLVDKTDRNLVVLSAIHKQNDGATPMEDKLRVRKRRAGYWKLPASERSTRDGREERS